MKYSKSEKYTRHADLGYGGVRKSLFEEVTFETWRIRKSQPWEIWGGVGWGRQAFKVEGIAKAKALGWEWSCPDPGAIWRSARLESSELGESEKISEVAGLRKGIWTFFQVQSEATKTGQWHNMAYFFFLKITLTALRTMDKRMRVEAGKPDRRLLQ